MNRKEVNQGYVENFMRELLKGTQMAELAKFYSHCEQSTISTMFIYVSNTLAFDDQEIERFPSEVVQNILKERLVNRLTEIKTLIDNTLEQVDKNFNEETGNGRGNPQQTRANEDRARAEQADRTGEDHV